MDVQDLYTRIEELKSNPTKVNLNKIAYYKQIITENGQKTASNVLKHYKGMDTTNDVIEFNTEDICDCNYPMEIGGDFKCEFCGGEIKSDY